MTAGRRFETTRAHRGGLATCCAESLRTCEIFEESQTWIPQSSPSGPRGPSGEGGALPALFSRSGPGEG
jgi:hypothetical protein